MYTHWSVLHEIVEAKAAWYFPRTCSLNLYVLCVCVCMATLGHVLGFPLI